MENVLVITKDPKILSNLKKILGREYSCESASDEKSGLQKFIERHCSIIFIDLSIYTYSQTQKTENMFQPFRKVYSLIPIIVMSPKNSIRQLVQALKAGANDYLIFPFNKDEVHLVMKNLLENAKINSELEYLRDQFWKDETLVLSRTLSQRMQKIFDQVRSVAPTMTTVLLTGETGTGKGVLARLIHRKSRRSKNPFISVHCGAIPETLIESELFGHEKGAFTSASMRKLGKFEIANGGTIFLDEIGSVSTSVQIKLLQVLQDKIYSRVGGVTVINADVRVIAASNLILQNEIDKGRFREDLFYRLNVFPIELPPLRERFEDIPLLVQEFLDKCNLSSENKILSVHPRVMEAFRSYHWPGNIRELENLIVRAHIMEQSQELTPESFPAELFSGGSTAQVHLNTSFSLARVRQEAIESVERQYLKQLLAEFKGKIDVSANAAGIGVRQLHKLLSKYKIRKGEYKSSGSTKKRKKSDI